MLFGILHLKLELGFLDMVPIKTFNPARVVKSYRGDKIVEHKLFDFVEAPVDDPAIKTWEKHLRDQGIPYVITQERGNWYPIGSDGKKGVKQERDILTIWKHLVVPYAENKRQK